MPLILNSFFSPKFSKKTECFLCVIKLPFGKLITFKVNMSLTALQIQGKHLQVLCYCTELPQHLKGGMLTKEIQILCFKVKALPPVLDLHGRGLLAYSCWGPKQHSSARINSDTETISCFTNPNPKILVYGKNIGIW